MTDVTYSVSLPEAIQLLKEAGTIEPRLSEAIEKVFQEFDRMHLALEFYAGPNNYDHNGAACDTDEHGWLDEADCGRKARWALRRVDGHGRALLPGQVGKVIAGMQG